MPQDHYPKCCIRNEYVEIVVENVIVCGTCSIGLIIKNFEVDTVPHSKSLCLFVKCRVEWSNIVK